MKLEFGHRIEGLSYRRRATAFGLLVRDGRLACVRVERGMWSYFDLPGGAVDGDESEEEALIREFVEETGLRVRAVQRRLEASQVFLKSDGAPIENHGGYWTVEDDGGPPTGKVEDDHELVWLDPRFAMANLRHDAHAWAVAEWIRCANSALRERKPI